MKERFIVNMCLTEVFHVFNIPTMMLRSVEVESKAFKNSRFLEEKEFIATWLPKHRVTFSIYVDKNGSTLIGLEGKVYLAYSDLMLQQSLPLDTLVLAHYTEDQVSVQEMIPKILIFDIVRMDSRSLVDTHPFERYKLLLSNCDVKKSNSIYSIQWVGFERSVIEKFEDLKISIPHDVEHVVRINQDPFCMSRLLALNIPKTCTGL